MAARPAPARPHEVADEIKAAGGKAVAELRHRRDGRGRRGAGQDGARQLRPPRHPGQRRRHPARPHDLQHERAGVGRRHRRPPEGPLLHDEAGVDPHAPAALRPHHQLLVDLRPRRAARAGELRRGEGGHRRLHARRRARPRPLRRHLQRDRARRRDAHDRHCAAEHRAAACPSRHGAGRTARATAVDACRRCASPSTSRR